MATDKINSIEKQMDKITTDVKYVRRDIKNLSGKIDDICKKMDDGFVRKEYYELETEQIKQDVGFVKGVIYTGGGVIALAILGALLNLIF